MTQSSRIEDPINKEILKLLSDGETYSSVSEKVFLSKAAVYWRVGKMLEEMNCKNTTNLVCVAIREQII